MSGKSLFFLLTAAFLATACDAPTPASDADLDAVYLAALHDYARTANAHGLLIPDSTDFADSSYVDAFVRGTTGPEHDAARDLQKRLKTRLRLAHLAFSDTSLHVNTPAVRAQLAMGSDMVDLNSEGSLQLSLNRFLPGVKGLISPSQIGISPDGTAAVVFIDMRCGLNCGEGWFYVLRRTNGVWKVDKRNQTSVI